MLKIALVTGGTRGIGAATATGLQMKGHKVAVTYHGNDKAAVAFTAKTGIPHFKFDVGNFEACKSGVAQIEAELGPIDILINNAGVTNDAFLHKMKIEQWQSVMRTNIDSVFNMSRLVIEGMRKRGWGRIINISSINGQTGQVGQTNYSASKAAVIGFTKALALESASKGVTVNAIAPGYIDTDMVHLVTKDVLDSIIAKIPMKRLGKPEEIAHMAVWLASDEASFATGATFTVNGAQYIT
ncbi:MAG TPA: acetoacetyl-CoA reductase [Alphaproteobacteria bacterium]|nr:acetoacetyl-CoA reductase [Alphaproteobacteria bacterium]